MVNDGTVNSPASTVDITADRVVAADQRRDAARLMRQATFGATRDAIDVLVAQGCHAWLNAQFAKPIVSHVTTVQADPNLLPNPWAVTMPSLWKQFFEGDDQLRQRVGYALSQIFVVSLNNNAVLDAPCGGAGYLDLLNRNAFGNVQDAAARRHAEPDHGRIPQHEGERQVRPGAADAAGRELRARSDAALLHRHRDAQHRRQRAS